MVIFLLLQIVTNNVFAEEFIKIPRLFTHFHHHSREHKDTKDFFDFLHKHYSVHHEKDMHPEKHNDEDNDCQLPFKHCSNCYLNSHAPAIGFISNCLSTNRTYFQVNDVRFISEDQHIESVDFCTIWQPPKIS